VDVNVPALPDIIGEATRLPDIDLFVPDGPKVCFRVSLFQGL
jgi:hypothetical protein